MSAINTDHIPSTDWSLGTTEDTIQPITDDSGIIDCILEEHEVL